MYPRLILSDWRSTRDALHDYARVLGAVRREMTPPRKHWWHITLQANARGLTTTPIPAGDRTVEIVLNPLRQRLEIDTSRGWHSTIDLAELSQRDTAGRLRDELRNAGVDAPDLSATTWQDAAHEYAREASRSYWDALTQIDSVFRRFKGSLREESGPVQIFPHHFDLSLNWFSGRLVPGKDPDDEESADEQINFGFVTGDASISEAYIYATAYPQPDGIIEVSLPDGAYWHTEGFTGAILPYRELVGDDDASGRLLEFLQTVRVGVASLMR